MPSILCLMVFNFYQIVNLYFMGHQGDSTMIAAIGLGNLIQQLVIGAVVFGFNGTSENELSKAFGAGNMTNCGIYMNRSRLMLAVALSICFLAIWNTKSILIAIEQDPIVS